MTRKENAVQVTVYMVEDEGLCFWEMIINEKFGVSRFKVLS